MNKKAENFQAYLDKAKLKDFTHEEIAKDPVDTVVFRSHLALEEARIPVILILDKSVYGIIRLLVTPKAQKKENEADLLKLINQYNRQYKAFKYYLDDAGNLVLDVSVLLPDDKVDGGLVYGLFQSLDQHLKEAYPKFMKLIWK